MAEIEVETINTDPDHKISGDLVRLWTHPKDTMQAIAQHETKIWWLPLLLLMASSLILNLSSTAISKQNTTLTLPPDMEYYSEEYQQEFAEVMDTNSGFVSTTLFPTLLKWVEIWGSWIVLATLLMVILLLQNHPLEWRNVFNLSAWSSLPFVIRDLLQSIYILTSKQLITSQGISGFAPPTPEGFSLYLTVIFTFIDIYLLWQVFLIFHGIHTPTRLSLSKTFLTILIAFLVSLALKALPGFVIAQISTLFSNGMGFFF